MPDPMTPLLARGKRDRIASEERERIDRCSYQTPQQQHAGHRRGRHRLIGCLTGADVTEDSRARVHLYMPHLHRTLTLDRRKRSSANEGSPDGSPDSTFTTCRGAESQRHSVPPLLTAVPPGVRCRALLSGLISSIRTRYLPGVRPELLRVLFAGRELRSTSTLQVRNLHPAGEEPQVRNLHPAGEEPQVRNLHPAGEGTSGEENLHPAGEEPQVRGTSTLQVRNLHPAGENLRKVTSRSRAPSMWSSPLLTPPPPSPLLTPPPPSPF
ncbi:hypothetical protein F7725_023548 [Dissostichus mawsoni]|uniref:Ubiquitin-like domain-containing protein n=1 Tax=Dissostichus mawsoni TaxID=36200 RepID=A0A7J5XYJ7_DISMA|nr:hypothetical protein F7725_023548 [Dissostichus mawsoni]